MKILFAADGSKQTKKALAYLATHDEILGTGGELVVVNVQAVVPTRVGSVLGAAAVKEYYAEQSDAVLNPIKKFLDKHSMRYRCLYVVGSAAEEIVKASKRERSHMIMMGVHGRGFVGRVMMGSVAQRVVAESDIPMLMIK